MIHFVRTFLIMRTYGVRLIAIKEVRNYRKIVGLCIKNVFENGWWEDSYGISYPSEFAPGHMLQKPSKESGIFQSVLAPIVEENTKHLFGHWMTQNYQAYEIYHDENAT